MTQIPNVQFCFELAQADNKVTEQNQKKKTGHHKKWIYLQISHKWIWTSWNQIDTKAIPTLAQLVRVKHQLNSHPALKLPLTTPTQALICNFEGFPKFYWVTILQVETLIISRSMASPFIKQWIEAKGVCDC